MCWPDYRLRRLYRCFRLLAAVLESGSHSFHVRGCAWPTRIEYAGFPYKRITGGTGYGESLFPREFFDFHLARLRLLPVVNLFCFERFFGKIRWAEDCRRCGDVCGNLWISQRGSTLHGRVKSSHSRRGEKKAKSASDASVVLAGEMRDSSQAQCLPLIPALLRGRN